MGSKMRGYRSTLRPTEVLNEACLRLLQHKGSWKDTGHVRALAALNIQEVLVDHVRSRNARKRGGDLCRVPLAEGHALARNAPIDTLDLDDALKRLAEKRPKQCEVVVLRYFRGLSFNEIARVMNSKPDTAKKYWGFARAWLKRELLKDRNTDHVH